MSKLDMIIQDINKKYKETIATKGSVMMYIDKIPFSSPRANYMTYGGVPVGKAIEFFGGEGGGKTTSALDITANAQKKAQRVYNTKLKKLQDELEAMKNRTGKQVESERNAIMTRIAAHEDKGPQKVVYVDAENTLDEEWATLLGVNVSELYLIRPQYQNAEQVLQIMLDLIDTGEVILIVLDSLPMLVPKALMEAGKTMEDKAYCGIAGPLSVFASKVSSKLSSTKTTMIIINQVREDLDNPYNLYSTPGGRAIKHLYSLRLLFQKNSFINDMNEELRANAENPSGNLVGINIAKTKVCKPDRRLGFYTLKYSTGIDVIADTIDMAIQYGFIIRGGSWFNIIDTETGEVSDALKFQGKAKLIEYLKDDEVIFSELYDKVMDKLSEE